MTDMASAAAGHDGAVASGKGPRAGQPKRRAFTAAYKARILREYDELESGRERGALLRREGLYSSHIDGWRKAREAGTENGLTDKPAGRPGRSTEAVENERLRRENEKLTAELARTKAALEVVGKAHALLELLSESADCRYEAAQVIDMAVTELEPLTSVKRACELLGKSRATLHRQRNPVPAADKAPPGPRAPHPAALIFQRQAI